MRAERGIMALASIPVQRNAKEVQGEVGYGGARRAWQGQARRGRVWHGAVVFPTPQRKPTFSVWEPACPGSYELAGEGAHSRHKESPEPQGS